MALFVRFPAIGHWMRAAIVHERWMALLFDFRPSTATMAYMKNEILSASYHNLLVI